MVGLWTKTSHLTSCLLNDKSASAYYSGMRRAPYFLFRSKIVLVNYYGEFWGANSPRSHFKFPTPIFPHSGQATVVKRPQLLHGLPDACHWKQAAGVKYPLVSQLLLNLHAAYLFRASRRCKPFTYCWQNPEVKLKFADWYLLLIAMILYEITARLTLPSQVKDLTTPGGCNGFTVCGCPAVLLWSFWLKFR